MLNIHKLAQQLRNPDGAIRRGAARELGKLGSAAEPAVGKLAIALDHDDDAFVRREAAHALGQIGPGAKRVFPILGRHVHDDANDISITCVSSLIQIGALKPLERALETGLSFELRLQLARTIAVCGEASRSMDGQEILNRLAEDPDLTIREAAQLARGSSPGINGEIVGVPNPAPS